MNFAKVKLIWLRELRDQLRDRRTLFTVAVLPILLYPLMGIVVLQVSQFTGQKIVRIWVVNSDQLPASPPLIETAAGKPQFIGQGDDANVEIVLGRFSGDPSGTLDQTFEATARSSLDSGKYDAIVYFPESFSEDLAAFRSGFAQPKSSPPAEPAQIPAPRIFYDASSDASNIARNRVEDALSRWRDSIVERTFAESNIPLIATRPFELEDANIAEASAPQKMVWSKIMPFVLMVWALTGAFYPAIDMCAGEKERGTLETLLTSPAQRSEIVWGKLLAVMTFSIATAILNLLSLGLTGVFIARSLVATEGPAAMFNLGMPPASAIAWLLVALVPAAAMFSALALAIAAMARSSKEGQYYLLPLLLVSLPLMILAIMPTMELSLGISLVPLTGLILLLRELIEGQYLEALRYAVPVIGVTAICMLLSIRWAIDQFNKEEVLFRESEQFSLGVWLRHIIRDRRETPTVAMAMLFGAVLLVFRFFSMFIPPPAGWNGFALLTLATLVGLIGLPAVIGAYVFTRSPRKTLLLVAPPPLSVLAAAALAICVHPLVHVVAELVSWVFPLSPTMQKQMESMNELLTGAPDMWMLVGLIALAPAICEELAFRGFVLSGLRHMGHKWGAIVISAALFGIAHGLLQQSVMATLTGVVIGYIAVQTGSLLPCVVYHFVNNSAALFSTRVNDDLVRLWPQLSWFFVSGDGGAYVFAWWVTAAGAVCALLILWWFSRLPHQSTREEALQKALDHQEASAVA
jgi:sodium transport system permease protein